VNDIVNGDVLRPELTFTPYTLFYRQPGNQPTTHVGLGYDVGVLNWMIQQAEAAGVPVK